MSDETQRDPVPPLGAAIDAGPPAIVEAVPPPPPTVPRPRPSQQPTRKATYPGVNASAESALIPTAPALPRVPGLDELVATDAAPPTVPRPALAAKLATDETDHAWLEAVSPGPPPPIPILSPPPPRPSVPEPPPSSPDAGGLARRKSRRTVKIPDDAVPVKAMPTESSEAPTPPAPGVGRSSAPPAETPAAPLTPIPPGFAAPSNAPPVWAPSAPPPPPRSTSPSVPEGMFGPLPPPRSPSPSVPEGMLGPLPPPRPPSPSVPEGFTPPPGWGTPPLPPPRPPSASVPDGIPPPPGWTGPVALQAPVIPRPTPEAAAAEAAFDAAKTIQQEGPRSVRPPQDSGVIQPMRIISIGTDTPPADVAPPPPVVIPPSRPSSPEVDPEEVEIEAADDEPDTQPSGALVPPPRDSETEIEPFEEVEPDRASDLAVQPVPSQPKKPPPPPPKRTSIEPPGSTPTPPMAAVAAAPAVATFTATPAISSPPPAAAPVAAPASPPTPVPEPRKRQKAWWEDLFGDDFMRTMDKIDPRIIRKECDFIEDRLGLERGAVMLDLACGPGAHAVELASRGYSVVGYDLSLAMLARAADEAQDRGQKLNFLHGDMREMAFEETFDGVYCWQTSFGYFEDEKNVNVLSRIHRALRKGGLLLLDVINRDYVAPRQPSLVWFEGEGCVCMDEMFVDFFTSRLRVKRTVMFEDGRAREVDYNIRLYGLNDLGKMLHECGFKVLEVTGHPSHPGVFFGSESPRIIILAERSERADRPAGTTVA